MSGDRKAGAGEFNCFCGQVHPLSMLGRSGAHPAPDPAPVMQPDLDAQWANAVAAARAQIKLYEAVTPGPLPAESLWDETSDMPEEVARAVSEVWLPALAAERARADQAGQQAADAWDEGYDAGAGGEYHQLGHNPYRVAPTAEQK